MKKIPVKNGLLLSAVFTAMVALPAFANTSGVDAILEAAAGKAPSTVAAPDVSAPVAKPSAPVAHKPTKKPVSPAPVTPHVVTHPAASMHQKPTDVVVGPVPRPVVSVPSIPHPVNMVPAPVSKPAAASPPMAPSQSAERMPATPPFGPMQAQPTSAVAPSPTADATAGYINPFMGTPGTAQKLSSTLSLLKLKTAIAKERAEYAKYDSQADALAMNGSPQLRQLEQNVSDLHDQIQALKAADVQDKAMAQAAEVHAKKAKNHLQVIAIITEQGQRSAIIQAGKLTKTVFAGESVNGHLIQAVDDHQVVLADGQSLPLQSQIGHYQSTSWKGNQGSGNIASPQTSGILTRLTQEAQKDGIPLSHDVPGQAPGAPNGLPPLNPAMLHP